MTRIRLTGFDQSDESTVASLSANLAELMQAMLQDGRALIALCRFLDRRYVQFWLQPDGRIIGEVVSNFNIGDSRVLEPRAEERLRELGFHEPALGPQPNWWFASTCTADDIRLVHMINAAIFDVLEERPIDPVSITTWMAVTQPSAILDEVHTNHRVYRPMERAKPERGDPEAG